jgi:ferrous iron transport protein B
MTPLVSEAVPLLTLVGPPNSGKTTLFNQLSGKNFKTVNYPGATVEYSLANIQKKYNLKANLLDSPGIISLFPGSPDEKVAIGALYKHPELGVPDVLIATADASQLSRHLFLIKQLLESNFKVVLALTMVDLLNKKGFDVSIKNLSMQLGCDIVKVDPRTGAGLDDLIKAVHKNLNEVLLAGKKEPEIFSDSNDMQKMIESYKNIEQIIHNVIYEIPSNGSPRKFDLDKANTSLKVIDAPNIKKSNNRPDAATLKIDKFLLHKFWGLISFFLIMSLTFTSIFWLADPLMSFVDEFFSLLAESSVAILGHTWFGDLVANGIISGAGSVLVFVPQILILFLILGLLEDTGYLARGAMLVDKPLSKIGLNGKSFVPLLSGFACAIPAMLAARTISNKRERILTIFILPLMSCSARLPVYALLIAFLLPSDKVWLGGIILASIYIFSILSSLIIAGLLNKFKHRLVKEEDNSSFILELPAYRKPVLSAVLVNTYSNTKTYIKKAGPIIVIFSLCLWFLTYFPNHSPEVDTAGISEEEISQIESAERLSGSYAAYMGKFIQPVMEPIGMDWRVGVSLIAAFAAREVFVSSMALIFKVTSEDEESIQASLLTAMRDAEIEETGRKLFTPATIVGLIVFFIFALQCLSTVAVSKKETGSWKIPALQVIVFTGLAYLLAFITVNGLRFLGID